MSPSDAPRVTCVVLNWNGWRDTVPCLQSLLEQDYQPLHVLAVDNASTDDSVAQIRARFPQISVIEAGANCGFAAGCNLGIRRAMERGAEFIWLLNNDTLAPPETLSKLVDKAADARLGIVGSVLRYMDRPEQIQAWGGGSVRRWMGFVTHFYAPAPLGPTSYITFASALIRREVFESAGLLDDGFFLYFEDADMTFRARCAGWKLAVAETAILHREGASSPTKKSARVDRMVTASGLRFLNRHGRPRRLSQVLFVLSRAGKRALCGNLKGVRGVLLGVRDWRRDEPMAFLEQP